MTVDVKGMSRAGRKQLTRMLSAGVGAVFLAATALAPQTAFAATSTASMNVSASVVVACTITAAALGFPEYVTAQVAPDPASTTLTVTCANGEPYSVSLNGGLNGTVAQRVMISGTAKLNYQLYTTSADATIFGDGTGGSSTSSGTGTGAGQTINVYGSIPAGQTETVFANYTDIVTATVTY
jgi:spore coat protein U-like protein